MSRVKVTVLSDASAPSLVLALIPAFAAAVRIPAEDERRLGAVVESILAGASGYVLKEIKGGDIVNAVRVVASGESLFEPALRVRVLDKGPEDELGA